MVIRKGDLFAAGDVFINYPFEEVMFRWNHLSKQIFRKFYGEGESAEVIPHDNGLYNDAILGGELISREDYERGRSRS